MTRSQTDIEIRKLRKKLRQIENLDLLDRDLTEEECLKVSKKKKVREKLQLLLSEVQDEVSGGMDVENSVEHSLESSATYSELEYSDTQQPGSPEPHITSTSETAEQHHPEQNYPPVLEAESITIAEKDDITEYSFSKPAAIAEKVPKSKTPPQKRQVSPSPSSSTPRENVEVKRSKTYGSGEPTVSSSQIQSKSTQKAKKEKPSSGLSSSVFQVTSCVGHNDLVVAMATDGEVLLSGSRDTTLKYWDVSSGAEIHSFGGHTGSVSAVCLMTSQQSQVFCSESRVDCDLPLDDKERIGLSGSTDCTLKVWALTSGQLLRSIYTFNPITCLQFVPEDHLVILATGGGKVEMWDVYTGENIYSLLAHHNLISSLQYTDHQVTTASVDGEIQVYQYSPGSLVCVYRSEGLKLRGGGAVLCRPVRSLVQHAGTIYYGDDGSSVKRLDWKQGVVSKLRNHVTEFGSTDALGIQGQTLCCSGYDLDVGLGYLNCRDLDSDAYMCTLCDELTGRIVCVSCEQNRSGGLVVVTGGLELKIWTQHTAKTKGSGDFIRPMVIPEYRSAPAHSDPESSGSSAESEESEDEDASRGRSTLRRRSHDSEMEAGPSGWRAWCHIL